MKKIFFWIVTMAVASFCICGILTACYVSNPADEKSVLGTYELVNYTKTHTELKNNTLDENDTETVTVDMISANEIKAFLVLKEGNTGYYVYKDVSNALRTREIRVQFTFDNENDKLIKQLKYNEGVSESGDGYPGKGEETLGVNFSSKRKLLEFTMPAILGRTDSVSVSYEKVSDAQDLSYVQTKLGENLSYVPYEFVNITNKMLYCGDFYSINNPYIYYFINFDFYGNKASVCYAKKDDETEVKLENATMSYVISENGDGLITVTVGEEELYIYNSDIPSSFAFKETSVTENGESFGYTMYLYQAGNQEAVKNDILNMYDEYKNNKEE